MPSGDEGFLKENRSINLQFFESTAIQSTAEKMKTNNGEP